MVPGGLWLDGARVCAAVLRPFTGANEEMLFDPNQPLLASRPEWVSEVIAHTVARIGSADMTPQLAHSLSVGDREALVLQARRIALGDRMQCVVRCSNNECREPMDLDLTISQLLLPPYSDWRPKYCEAFEKEGTRWNIRFRLPTGADQSAVAGVTRADPEAGAAALLDRCVLDARPENGATVPPAALPPAVIEALAERMAQLDPQAEVILQFVCSACGAQGSAVLDAADYLLRELSQSQLYREVHVLALHYHWSEREILELSRAKRHRYLALLAQTQPGVSAP